MTCADLRSSCWRRAQRRLDGALAPGAHVGVVVVLLDEAARDVFQHHHTARDVRDRHVELLDLGVRASARVLRARRVAPADGRELQRPGGRADRLAVGRLRLFSTASNISKIKMRRKLFISKHRFFAGLVAQVGGEGGLVGPVTL